MLMLGFWCPQEAFLVVKWDVEAFMRCVFGDNDTPREQGAWALEVPMGGRAVIMQTGPVHQRSHVWDTTPLWAACGTIQNRTVQGILLCV